MTKNSKKRKYISAFLAVPSGNEYVMGDEIITFNLDEIIGFSASPDDSHANVCGVGFSSASHDGKVIWAKYEEVLHAWENDVTYVTPEVQEVLAKRNTSK